MLMLRPTSRGHLLLSLRASHYASVTPVLRARIFTRTIYIDDANSAGRDDFRVVCSSAVKRFRVD